jgi:phosphoserine aminotransferase
VASEAEDGRGRPVEAEDLGAVVRAEKEVGFVRPVNAARELRVDVEHVGARHDDEEHAGAQQPVDDGPHGRRVRVPARDGRAVPVEDDERKGSVEDARGRHAYRLAVHAGRRPPPRWAKVTPMHRTMNFNAGPATLPLAALERAREELLDFAGSGMSVMEHSHRGKEYEAVHDEALALLRELLGVPASHEILFLQGGASMQFALVPMSFLPPSGSADYVVTGAWSEKAFAEASAWAGVAKASVRIAASTKDGGYRRVLQPEEARLDESAAYVHWTSNETIHGVQYLEPVRFGRAPQVCDVSSDFLWRKIDVAPFSLLYGGAQKNIGPSGVTVVIADRGFIERGRKDLPSILQYRAFAEAKSLLNTPPTFGIYLVRNVLVWLKGIGGLDAIEQRNRAKASVLYRAIDENADFYRCPVEPGSRSVMNVVFRLPSEELEKRFVDETKKAGMVGLKGHRSVGGIRVSLYNAVEPEWVAALTSFMKDFAKRA